MRALARLLAPGGQAVVRIPVASSYAWRRYGVNWINLDAPRHFFLHTFKSIELLARDASLVMGDVIHEGNGEQIWGSEQFEKDIPSNDPRSIGSSQFKRLLAWNRIRDCGAKARELNEKGEADLVCFHLRKAE